MQLLARHRREKKPLRPRQPGHGIVAAALRVVVGEMALLAGTDREIQASQGGFAAVLHPKLPFAGQDFLALGGVRYDSSIGAEDDMPRPGKITVRDLFHHAIHILVMSDRAKKAAVLLNRQI